MRVKRWRLNKCTNTLNRPDDLPGEMGEETGGPGNPAGAGGGGAQPPGGPSEQEKQAQIEANRQRMARLNQKK